MNQNDTDVTIRSNDPYNTPVTPLNQTNTNFRQQRILRIEVKRVLVSKLETVPFFIVSSVGN
ncbi:hypothetical protein [Neobacillus kokaensis]|uniref:Uncharacterized protein n=1 Tax=Neobacillus kokaensis TaxID=2759023 RepID=A0ABQ3MZE0_9BACI|nr:hypothetical protein [Neobacillus kokaensis]GHH96687.1 hypothetical protein AM1BK_02300 [Neobacillus kokaensis]